MIFSSAMTPDAIADLFEADPIFISVRRDLIRTEVAGLRPHSVDVERRYTRR